MNMQIKQTRKKSYCPVMSFLFFQIGLLKKHIFQYSNNQQEERKNNSKTEDFSPKKLYSNHRNLSNYKI